jgi:hypothetical protein
LPSTRMTVRETHTNAPIAHGVGYPLIRATVTLHGREIREVSADE